MAKPQSFRSLITFYSLSYNPYAFLICTLPEGCVFTATGIETAPDAPLIGVTGNFSEGQLPTCAWLLSFTRSGRRTSRGDSTRRVPDV